MHDALRYALVIEVSELLAKDEVLEQRRPAQSRLQRVLIVADRDALIRRERSTARVDAYARERIVRGVSARRRRLAGFRRRVAFRQRARTHLRVQGVDTLPGLRPRGRLAVLARFRGIERKRLRNDLGGFELRGGGVTSATRMARRTADRAARRRLRRICCAAAAAGCAVPRRAGRPACHAFRTRVFTFLGHGTVPCAW